MDNQIQKPINLLIDDVKREVYMILSKDNLPVSVINLILNEITLDVNRQAKQAVDQERTEYQEKLKAEQEAREVEGKN